VSKPRWMRKFPAWQWYVYTKLSGRRQLVHPLHFDTPVPCPHCGKSLVFTPYNAACCGQQFGTERFTPAVWQKAPLEGEPGGRPYGWSSLVEYSVYLAARQRA